VAPLSLAPGARLALLNVGYVAVLSFGALALGRQHAAWSGAVVPVYAASVVAVRVLGSSIPDRIGARPALALSATTASAGLLGFAVAPLPAVALLAIVVSAAGQALAVPALGLLALERVPPERRGAAAGTFFAFFDVGVGAGGPALGVVAAHGGPAGALVAASAVVLAAGAVRGIRKR
jgi:MFS family permease